MSPAGTYSTDNPAGPRPQLNRAALASVLLAVSPLFGVGSVHALIYGYRARREVGAAPGRQGGRDLAEVGIALGWAGVILAVVLIPFGVMLLLALRASYGG